MRAKLDLVCHVCKTIVFEDEEYGLAMSERTQKFEQLCILCIKSSLHLGYEVEV